SRTPLGVAKGIRDPLRGDGVLRVARVAYQHPPGSGCGAEEVRNGHSDERSFAPRIAHARGERWREIEHIEKRTFDVFLVRLELRVRPAADNEREAVVRR